MEEEQQQPCLDAPKATMTREEKEKWRAQLMTNTLMDDIMLREGLRGNPAAVEEILRVVLSNDQIRIVHSETQKDLMNMHGRSLELDVFAEDENGIRYNIEIQKKADGAHPKRARFHASMIDWDESRVRERFDELPVICIVFVTQTDVRKRKKAVNHYSMVNVEDATDRLDIGLDLYYVNASYEGDDSIGRMMADFRAVEPSQMFYPELRNIMKYIKGTKEGVETMTLAMNEYYHQGKEDGIEQGKEQGIEQGKEQGRDEKQKENILYMFLIKKISVEQIADLLNESIDSVRSVIQSHQDGGNAHPAT